MEGDMSEKQGSGKDKDQMFVSWLLQQSQRIQEPGLFFELPKVGNQKKKEYTREDLSGHSRHCHVLHMRKLSPRETTDFA